MDIVNEIKISLTLIDRDAPSGALPFDCMNADELATILKNMIDADALQIDDIEQFEVERSENTED